MAETINIAEIAAKLSKEIFKYFHWESHPLKDANFECSNENHTTKGGAERKSTHPGDVVFSYNDPYLDKRVYLHTDLKSYKKDSITTAALRDAFKSMCMTIECANESENWRLKYSVESSEQHDVRGLLFVHNYDHKYENPFYDAISRIDLQSLPLQAGQIIHYLGPQDIQRLYNICNDIIRLRVEGDLPEDYTFYYPDLVMQRRQGDVWEQPATIEMLTGPYVILKHRAVSDSLPGYTIYYNRPGETPEEFEYFIDSLSRYQMLDSDETLRIRITNNSPIEDVRSIFRVATKKYAKAWGFDPARTDILKKIEIDKVTSVTNTFNPGDMGWRE